MLSKIKSFFEEQLAPDQNPDHDQKRLRIAAAALMFEVARADASIDELERDRIRDNLSRVFSLDDKQLNELTKLAELEADDATSIYQFSQLINNHYQEREKIQLIHLLWQVANADGAIDKYEDHFIRKVAELIYVSHSDFIKVKLQVLGNT